MITEQQLDEMARKVWPLETMLHNAKRGEWKDQYRKLNPEQFTQQPAYVGNPSLPAERIQNGLQYQEEMLRLGFNKLKVIPLLINPTPDLRVNINIDVSAAREHFQHVNALIANTATQQAYRQELEFIQTLLDAAIYLSETAEKIQSMMGNRQAHLTHCLAELEAQFADLEQKIFGTDKPDEQ